MTMGKRLGLALLLAACGASGCGDDGADHVHEGMAGENGNHAGHDGHAGDDGGLEPVPCPDTIPEFVATPSGGLEVTGTSKRVTAKLIDADWRPPFKGDNEWTIVFRDSDGEPLEDVEVKQAETFMPAHNHAGKKAPKATQLDEPGTFLFKDVNLFMGGPWEARFDVTSPSAGGDDHLVFHVCVE